MGVVPHIPDKQCVDSGGYVLQCAMGIPVLDPLMVLSVPSIPRRPASRVKLAGHR